MKTFIERIVFSGLAVFLAACGGDQGGPDSGNVQSTDSIQSSTSSSGKIFEKDIRSKPCEILTTEMVARVAGVDAAGVEQRSISTMCLYSWDGGQAMLGHLRAGKTIKSARTRFENAYKTQTPEEVQESLAAIDAQIKKQNSAGKTDVTPEQAKLVTGGLGNAFAGGLQFEDIQGLGDIARFETTRTETKVFDKTIVSYSNSLNVLISNLKFTVSFSLDGEPKLYRDENIALAKAVLDAL